MHLARVAASILMVALSLVVTTSPATAEDAPTSTTYTIVCAPGSPPEATWRATAGDTLVHTCAETPYIYPNRALGVGISTFAQFGSPVPVAGIPTATGIPTFTLCETCDGTQRPPLRTCQVFTDINSAPGWDCQTRGETQHVTVVITLHYLPTRTMSAFGAPVDAQPVENVAQAGRSIPFKFSVANGGGAPVAGLTDQDVTLKAELGPCDRDANADVIESYASGSGLKNLGGGAYNYVFQTPKSWAGKCGDVTVSAGSGASRTASFRFKG